MGLRHVLDELRLDLRLDVDLKLADLGLGHLFERGLRPRQEPVDGAAVDQAGEHARAVAELGAHGREAEHEVQVRADTVEEEGPQLGRGRLLLGALLLEGVAHLAEYRVHLVTREEVGQLACSEHGKHGKRGKRGKHGKHGKHGKYSHSKCCLPVLGKMFS